MSLEHRNQQCLRICNWSLTLVFPKSFYREKLKNMLKTTENNANSGTYISFPLSIQFTKLCTLDCSKLTKYYVTGTWKYCT